MLIMCIRLETLHQVINHTDGRVFRVRLQINPASGLGVAPMPRCQVTIKQSIVVVNRIAIGPLILEIFMFESVYGRTDAGSCPIL